MADRDQVQWWLQQGTAGSPVMLLVTMEDAALRGEMPCRVLGTLKAAPPQEAPSDSWQVAAALAAIGVPTNLLGYAYLREALLMLLRQPEQGRRLSRTVYPAIAGQFGVSAGSVERAIRHAIAQTWLRGGAERYRHALGRLGSIVGERPTNGEFLTQVAEGIRVHAMAV